MKRIFAFALIIGAPAIFNLPAKADSVNFYSGVSLNGTYDDQIHMLTGPIDGPLTNDFSSPDTFAAALNGPSAFIVEPHSSWADNSPAQWISSDPNGGAGGAYTALYAISFTLPEFTFASFNITFTVDQSLGDAPDNGLFLNGTALPGSAGGNYSEVISYNNEDVTSLLHAGDNILYLYNVNYGGPAGISFNATVDFTPAPVPEPSTYALFGLGTIAGLILRRYRTNFVALLKP